MCIHTHAYICTRAHMLRRALILRDNATQKNVHTRACIHAYIHAQTCLDFAR